MSVPLQPLLSDLPGIFKPASHWLKLLRERRIGAVELLNMHLVQLDRYNEEINAVIAKDLEGALTAAWSADNTEPSAQQSLHGLPMTIQDTYEVIGMPATCGLQAMAHHRPRHDADAVARLRSAGAIIYGKTNTTSSAADWQSTNLVYGTTNNPWDPSRSPGGSSGGPAAAVACGFSPLELGSDMDGSIRIPAMFCGIYGHKPSAGIVPMRGHLPPFPGRTEHLPVELGIGGPMARSAADLELALDVLAAPSDRERTAWTVTIPSSRRERLRDFRVALWADDNTFATEADCLAAVHAWADDLRRLGVKVNMKARPNIDWHAAYDTYLMTLLPYSGADATPWAIRQVIEEGEADHPESYRARQARAFKMSHLEYFAVRGQREALFQRWREFFVHHDLLICPTYCTVASLHDPRGAGLSDPIAVAERRRTMVNGLPRPYCDGLQWPSIASVANLPATTIPIGRLVQGMPMGVQAIGPYLEDRTPIRFAQLLEDAMGPIRLAPGIA